MALNTLLARWKLKLENINVQASVRLNKIGCFEELHWLK